MKKLVLVAICGVFMLNLGAIQAKAEDLNCVATAAEKKLAGAARTSFMKKCQAEATKTCDASAGEKHLKGAAKTSFTKKCMSDAVGS